MIKVTVCKASKLITSDPDHLNLLLNYPVAELEKRPVSTLLHPEDWISLSSSLASAVGSDQTQASTKIRWLDGRGRIQLLDSVIVSQNNSVFSIEICPSGLSSFSKEEDGDLAFSALIASSYDGYWDWFIQEDSEYMSPRFWEIFGFEAYEMPHHPSAWQGLINQEDLKNVLECYSAHVASKGEVPYAQEVRYEKKDGSTAWVLCRGKVIEWAEDDSPLRMVGSHTDITDLKRHGKLRKRTVRQRVVS